MVVELGWFIFYPVKKELDLWWQRRAELRWHLPTYRSVAILVFVLGVLLVPWQNSIRAPALIMAEQAQGIYSPHEGQVVESLVKLGQKVEVGQVLARLHSPELDYQSQLAKVQAEQLRLQWQQQSLYQTLQNTGPALDKRWEAAQQKLHSIDERRDQLTLTAPFAGVVVGRNDSLTANNWISSSEKLFQIIGADGIKGEAFITEEDALRLQKFLGKANQEKISQEKIKFDKGNEQKKNEPKEKIDKTSLKFIANQPGFPRLHCQVSGMDKVNISQLDYTYLASSYGGSIPTQTDTSQSDKQQKLIPLDSRFRLRFHECTGSTGTHQELAGVVTVYGERKNFISRIASRAMALWNFEAGF